MRISNHKKYRVAFMAFKSASVRTYREGVTGAVLLLLPVFFCLAILTADTGWAQTGEEIRHPILPPPDIRLAISAGGGYALLFSDWADYNKPGPFAQLGVVFSYPARSIASPFFNFSVCRHRGKADNPPLTKYLLGGGLNLHLPGASRIQPYFQLSLALALVDSDLIVKANPGALTKTGDIGAGGGLEVFFGIERKISVNVGAVWHYTRAYVGDENKEHSKGIQSVQFPVSFCYYIY
jgi:hypothetical protein